MTAAMARQKLDANRATLRTMCPRGVKTKDVRDIATTLENKFLYEMEMVNRRSNFGAASDVLRIKLLCKYGGRAIAP